ncbi:anthrone oxygenase family protein [Kineococcus gypseus]|uniref:anthrone oxygenase family protein n=1 Tax=Kineococcus gypseus TaxID=1637102 RepID=UPI003D7C7E28
MTSPADLAARAARAAPTAHDACTAALVLAVVPDLGGHRRRAPGFGEFVSHQQHADTVMSRLAPALSVAVIATGTAAAASLARRAPVAAAWRAAGAACVAGAVALTVRVHVPFNRRLRTWDPRVEVPGWREGRARWERAHQVRRALAVLAGACALAARRRTRAPR